MGSVIPAVVVISGLVALLVVAGFIVRRRARTWAADVREVGFAVVQVSIEPINGSAQDVILTLDGTTRAHPIAQLNVERADAALVGLEPPEGFALSDAAASKDLIVWRPLAPPLLEPGTPKRLTFRFSNVTGAPIRIGVHVAATMRIGGGVLIFGVSVPLADERRRQAANLRSALMVKGRALGVAAKELPEWPGLLALEREIGK